MKKIFSTLIELVKWRKKTLLASFLFAKQTAFFHLWCDSGRRERDATFGAWERICYIWSGVGPVIEFRTQHCLKATGSMLRLLDREKNPKALPSTAVEGCSVSCLSSAITHIHPPILVGSPALIPELWHRGCHCTGLVPRATVGLGIFGLGGKKLIWYLRFCACWVRGWFSLLWVFFWVCSQNTQGMDWVHQQHSEVVSCRDSPVSASSKT